MIHHSKIFDPWLGCMDVSKVCNNCVASRWLGQGKKNLWGRNTRIETSDREWKLPLKWNRAAEGVEDGIDVYASTSCDWASRHAPNKDLQRLWNLIRRSQNINWFQLSAEPSKMKLSLPKDWNEGYANVVLGAVIGHPERAEKTLELLKQIPSIRRFIAFPSANANYGKLNFKGIDWVAVRGEPYPIPRKKPHSLGALELEVEEGDEDEFVEGKWVGRIIDQCYKQRVSFANLDRSDFLDNPIYF